jgi:hypothetical protein
MHRAGLRIIDAGRAALVFRIDFSVICFEQIEVLDKLFKRNAIRDAIDDQAHCTGFRVRTHQNRGSVEHIVQHARHRNQQLTGQTVAARQFRWPKMRHACFTCFSPGHRASGLVIPASMRRRRPLSPARATSTCQVRDRT